MEERKGTTNVITKILTRVLVIGFGVQIALGVFWACLQFPYFQEFGESYFLLKVQASLVCDEYMGILYPLLIKGALAIASIIPIPYYCCLYALQLAVAVLSARYFLGAFPAIREKNALFGWFSALAMMSFPMAMQCHVAVLPHSLAASAFMLQLGIAIRASFTKDLPSKRITLIGILWLVEILLLPEYRLFGGILLTACAIWEIFQTRQTKTGLAGMMAVVIVTAAMLGIVPQIWHFTVTEGAYGRMRDTAEAAAMRRFAWDDFGELYGYWPEELKEALTQEDIAICNKYPEKKLWILGEKVDGVYGKEKAREIYAAVAKAGKQVRMKRNLKEILKDGIGYAFAPLAQLSLMEGKGGSGYSASNYEIMRMKNPRLTSLYVRYSDWFFVGALFISLLLLGAVSAGMDGKERFALLKKGLGYLCLGGLFMCVYVTRGGGILDQKNGLPVTMLWAAFACIMASIGVGGAKK